MVQIKLLTDRSGLQGYSPAGSVIEVPDDEGERYVLKGLALYVAPKGKRQTSAQAAAAGRRIRLGYPEPEDVEVEEELPEPAPAKKPPKKKG